MKLNNDCLRDVMLVCEQNLKYVDLEDGYLAYTHISLPELVTALTQYTKPDIFYAVYMLDQAGFIKAKIQWIMGGVGYCEIQQMTFAGHEFLEKIRDTKNWTKTKAALSAVRNYSLDAIQAISQGITSGAISAYLEKHPG